MQGILIGFGVIFLTVAWKMSYGSTVLVQP